MVDEYNSMIIELDFLWCGSVKVGYDVLHVPDVGEEVP